MSFLSEMLKFFKNVEEANYVAAKKSDHDMSLSELKSLFDAWYTGQHIPPMYGFGNKVIAQIWRNCDPKSTPEGQPGFVIGGKGGIDAVFQKALSVVRPYVFFGRAMREFDIQISRYYDLNLKADSSSWQDFGMSAEHNTPYSYQKMDANPFIKNVLKRVLDVKTGEAAVKNTPKEENV